MADDQKTAQEQAADPFIDALVEVLMEHAAPNGAVDYPKTAAAFVKLLAEMIGPQPDAIRNQMLAEVSLSLRSAVNIAVLKIDVMKGMQ